MTQLEFLLLIVMKDYVRCVRCVFVKKGRGGGGEGTGKRNLPK